jgi:hypothetical protein
MLGIANAVRVGMPQDVTGKKCGARENVAVLWDRICGVLYSIVAIIQYMQLIFTLSVLLEESCGVLL